MTVASGILCVATSVEYINTVHTVIIDHEGHNFADICHCQVYPLAIGYRETFHSET